VRSARYRPLFRQFYVLFILDCLLLGYLGAQPAEGIYIVLARIGTIYYFAHFLVVLPVLGLVEKPKAIPESISEPVLAAKPAE
jgi:ubiquinol-cytochrome c reductase cytochrome b subunit